MDDVEIHGTDSLFSGFGELQCVRFSRQLSSGERVSQQWEVYRRADCAAVLPYDAERRTALLISQFRVPAYLNGGRLRLIEACAGLIDAGETPDVCAVREAREECGYALKMTEPAGVFYTSPGAFTERVHLFLAPYRPQDRVSAGGGEASEHEDIEVIETPLGEVAAMMADGTIENAITGLLVRALQVARPELFS